MRLNSLNKAARKHRISQSAISQAIVSLERSLGLALLSHGQRVVRITDEGEALLPHLEALFAQAESLHIAADGLKSGYGGTLRLGCTNSIAIGILPLALNRYKQVAAAVEISVLLGNSETLTQSLLRGEIDLGLFVTEAAANKELSTISLRQGSYLLVKHNREKRHVAVAGLIVTRRQRPEVLAMRAALAQDNKEPPVSMELISWEGIKSYLALGSGYGILPDYVLNKQDRVQGLEEVPLDFAPPSYEVVAATKARQSLRRNVSLMLQILQKDQAQRLKA